MCSYYRELSNTKNEREDYGVSDKYSHGEISEHVISSASSASFYLIDLVVPLIPKCSKIVFWDLPFVFIVTLRIGPPFDDRERSIPPHLLILRCTSLDLHSRKQLIDWLIDCSRPFHHAVK